MTPDDLREKFKEISNTKISARDAKANHKLMMSLLFKTYPQVASFELALRGFLQYPRLIRINSLDIMGPRGIMDEVDANNFLLFQESKSLLVELNLNANDFTSFCSLLYVAIDYHTTKDFVEMGDGTYHRKNYE